MSLADLDDMETEYARATDRLVQNLHSGISRRDWHATEVAANAVRDSAWMKDASKLVDFFVTTMAIDVAEQEYFTRSNDVHDRWETADHKEFDDIDRASRAIDEMKEHRTELRFALAHLLIPVESAR